MQVDPDQGTLAEPGDRPAAQQSRPELITGQPEQRPEPMASVGRVLPNESDHRPGRGQLTGRAARGQPLGCHDARARSAIWMVARMLASIASVGMPGPPSTA